MRNIVHFIVIMVFGLGIIAPACGFTWGGGNYNLIEICTAQGFEKRLVKDDTDPPTHHIADQCQFCFANTHLTDNINFTNLQSIEFTYQEHQYFTPSHQIVAIFLSHAYQPRAPPFLV